jgi:hypothetical protein
MRRLCFVSIPYEDFKDFETFLYGQIKYPIHGFVRYVSNDYQIYVLDLEEDESIMITLRFQDAKIDPFNTTKAVI